MDFKWFLLLGLSLVLIGIFVITIGLIKFAEKAKVEGGGVIVIGPFPIAFGTNESIAKVMVIVGIIIALLFLLLACRLI